MIETLSEFYVYVYIDPRNFEEFYYGKGKGNRKNAHSADESDSEKAKRIKAIKKEGLEPIIKVIARGLTRTGRIFDRENINLETRKKSYKPFIRAICRQISPS